MKTLIIFFMAIAAINAFFLSDKSREEFYQEMEKIFSNPHKFLTHGNIRTPLESIKLSELLRAVETFQAISETERSALINYLFGERFPRPVPASHMENTHPFDEEKLKEIHDKWEAMTPEEREEVRNNRRKDFESFKPDFIQRFPRGIFEDHHVKDHPHFDEQKMEEIHAKWEEMTPEERDNRIVFITRPGHQEHHHKIKETDDSLEVIAQDDGKEYIINKMKERHDKFESLTPDEQDALKERIFVQRFPKENHPHFDEEKMDELRAKWEAMTPEEREEMKRNFRKNHGEVKSRSRRSIQAIRPLPELIDVRPYPNDIPNTRPMPERPIARPEDNIGRPVWISHPFPVPEKPIGRPEDRFGMTRPVDWLARPVPLPEFDRVLYPIDGNFQPIKPLQEFETPMVRPASDNGRTRPVDPISRDRMPQPIRPLPIRKSSTGLSTMFDDMSEEERLQVIRELFPDGLPIRPIGPIPIIPAEDKKDAKGLKLEDIEESVPIEQIATPPRGNPNENNRPMAPKPPRNPGSHPQGPLRPIENNRPHAPRPIENNRPHTPRPEENNGPHAPRPIENNRPHAPRPEENNGPHAPRPIENNRPHAPRPEENNRPDVPKPEFHPRPSPRSANFQPILPLKRQPILPLERQPILPLKRQPILPLQTQPILPFKFQPIMPL